ncbi:Nucleolar complex protein 3 homolog [Coccomyxa sp. Obi]|nr:Nucleolar complex protein 3 homolog [Coccomyxa sp. Obi]
MGKKRPRSNTGGKPVRSLNKKPKKVSEAPLPDGPDDSDLEVSEEDVQFVDEYSKRLGFLTSLNKEKMDKSLQKPKEKKVKEPAPAKAVEADEAEEYEQVPRGKLSEKEQGPRAAPLPLKVGGQLVYPDSKEAAASKPAPAPRVAGITIEEDEEEDAERPVVSDDADGEEEEDADSVLVTDDDEYEDVTSDGAGAEEDSPEESDFEEEEAGPGRTARQRRPVLRDELQEYLKIEERREELKQQTALAALRLLQDPEQHLRDLTALVDLTRDRDELVARLAMLSLAAVFKDILPGYRVRLPTEKELAMPVSKEVKKVRDYESALLRAYQAYLKALLAACNAAERRSRQNGAAAAPGPPAAAPSLATPRVAVRCLAMLLTSLPHFNHASDVLQAVVPRMAHRDEAIAAECCGAVGRLLAADAAGDGSAARDAVQLVADLVKLRRCVVRPEVVRVLLGLQLSSAVASDVKSGDQREHKSRKTRKKEKRARRGRGEDEVSAAFKEAALSADAAARRRTQSETLEALFEIFFRALKHCTASGFVAPSRTGSPVSEARAAKRFPLLAPSLEGLRRFAHLISVEYFSDLLAVMVQIAAAPGLPARMRLHVLLTASDILKGQGDALNVDRQDLYQALFSVLAAAPLGDLEPLRPRPGAAAGDEPDQAAGGRGGPAGPSGRAAPAGEPGSQNRRRGWNAAADASAEDLPFEVLLVRTAHQMLVEQSRALDTGRMAALALRVAATAQFMDTGGALGLLAVLERMLRQNHRLRGMLDAEPGGPVPPLPRSSDPHNLVEAARVSLGSQFWQLHALAAHHPSASARQSAAAVAAMPADGSASGHHIGLFARPDGPPGVAAAHSRPAASHAQSSAVQDSDIAQLQGMLDSYYSKALAVGENQAKQEECTKLALQIAERVAELVPARAAEKRAAAAATAAAATPRQGGGKKGDRKGKGGGAGKKTSQGKGTLERGQNAAVKQKV